MILKLFLGCVRKLYVGRIQTGHTYLISLKVWTRSWWGIGLGDHTCLIQLIYLLGLKWPSFVDYLLVCIIFIVSESVDPENCPRCVSKFPVGHIQTIRSGTCTWKAGTWRSGTWTQRTWTRCSCTPDFFFTFFKTIIEL